MHESHDTNDRFAISGWGVEQLRATTFHDADPIMLGRMGLWEEVVGTSPVSINTQPQERFMSQTGNLGERSLLLAVRPDRVDWILHPPAPLPREVFPSLGDSAEAIGAFNLVVKNWLILSSRVLRIAFGSVLMSQVDDVGSGLLQLSEYLPSLRLDPPIGEDFLYQINRPRMSRTVSNVLINRLAKWSMVQAGSVGISIGPSASPTLHTTPVQLARRLELDINTATDNVAQCSSEEVCAVFEELAVLGCELANEGDIP